MNCPACKTVVLSMSERNGIEIDFCPQCRGVWLDRGELDKIIEKSNAAVEPVQSAGNAPVPPGQPQAQPFYPNQHHGKDYYKYKRRKSFLEELFD